MCIASFVLLVSLAWLVFLVLCASRRVVVSCAPHRA